MQFLKDRFLARGYATATTHSSGSASAVPTPKLGLNRPSLDPVFAVAFRGAPNVCRAHIGDVPSEFPRPAIRLMARLLRRGVIEVRL